MKIIKSAIRFLVFFYIFSICESTVGQTLFRSDGPRFRIEIPEGWEQKTPKGPNIKLLIKHPSGSSINIMVHEDEDFRKRKSHDITKEETLEELKGMTNVKVFSYDKIYVNLHEAVYIKFKWDFKNVNQIITLYTALIQIIYEDKLYYLNFTSDESSFENLESDFLKTLSTFVIEENFAKPKN